MSDSRLSPRERRQAAKSRARTASNDELFGFINERSSVLAEEACEEVQRRGLYEELARAILAGTFTRAQGRVCAANTFDDRAAALIGFDALLTMFRSEKVPDVLTNTLLKLVCVRYRMGEVKEAINEARERFHDPETLGSLDGAERSLQTGRIGDYSEFYVPHPSFGFKE